MSIINNGLLLAAEAAAAGGYTVSRSLRFNAPDSAFLSRTPGSAGNRRTWTYSAWVKRTTLDAAATLLAGGNVSQGGGDELFFNTSSGSNEIRIAWNGAVNGDAVTLGVFRDPSAWYHIILAVDTTQSTDSNRVKLYVNGAQQTLTAGPFGGTYGTYPAQNYDTEINSATDQWIGRHGNTYGSFYIADIHFIDGQALTPSSFAETDATTGQWVPKAFSGGSYGTNGFRLTFSDNSGTTATTLGKDAAGSNNWTPNNFSVASGSGNDSLVDSPTSYGTDTGVGGEVRGNYATWNPLFLGNGQGVTLSNGNLDYLSTASSGNYATRFFTIATSSGKWYVEFSVAAVGNGGFIGITNNPDSINNYIGQNASSWVYFGNGTKWTSGSSASYGASWTGGDVIGLALDLDNGTLTFYKNGTSQGTAYSSLPAGTYFIGISGTTNFDAKINAGARPFAYTAPSGFKALCDTNLPAPTIAKPSTVMDVKLYTGNGSTQTISGLGFSPDFVWTKSRNLAASHGLHDIIRGTNNVLRSNLTDGELSQSGSNATLTSFNSDGFTAGADQFVGCINFQNYTYAAFCWDAGTSTVTNTQGSITSQVRANASAGFSIVTYTAASSSGTVGHGLGIAPRLVITKRRDGTSDWVVQTNLIPQNYLLFLNSTQAQTSISGSGVSNIPLPTSSVFSVDNITGLGVSGTYVAYCFAPVAGYSSFGSYTGNGSADGPFVYTGFRPKYLLLKRSDSNYDWAIWDSARGLYNATNNVLFPYTSLAEDTSSLPVDFLSNGFKLRSTYQNVSAGTFIYIAFAENPFQYARAR